MKFSLIFSHSVQLSSIILDSFKFIRILSNFLGLFWNVLYSLGFSRIVPHSSNFSALLPEFRRILPYLLLFFRIHVDPLELFRIISDSAGFSRIIFRFSQIPTDSFEIFCIVPYSIGFFLIPPDSFRFSRILTIYSLLFFRTLRIHTDSPGFSRVFSVSLTFFRILFYSVGIWLDSLEFSRVFWILTDSLRVSRILIIFYHILSDSLYEIFSEFTRILSYPLGIWKDPLKFSRIFMFSLGFFRFFRILSHSLEFFWILADSFQICRNLTGFSCILLDTLRSRSFSDCVVFFRNLCLFFGFCWILPNHLWILQDDEI